MKTDGDLIDALPGDLRRIAEVAGVEAAVKIARAFRGTFLYVPGLDEMMRRVRDAIIKTDYDGGPSARKLAQKNGLTERHIWRILNSPHSDIPEEVLNLLKDGG